MFKISTKSIVIALIAISGSGVLVVVGLIIFIFTGLSPVNSLSQDSVKFIIPKGQAISVIGTRLQQEHLIKSPLLFRFVVWKEHLSAKIQAGTFNLSPAFSTVEIAKRLTMGTEDQWVTIPEGKRKEEVVGYFDAFDAFDPQEFLALSKNDEGYLFPDTYLLPLTSDAKTVYEVMRKRFDQVVSDNDIEKKAKAQGKSLKDIVILASILEREAKHAEDMKVVAGILNNRLDAGMPLQVDATLQYIKGYDPKTKNWWRTPLAEDKKLNSAFNTYLKAGLPPSPITNPSLNALTAAVEPTESEYFYYITDNSGQMHYSKTYEEHLANVQKYLK